MITDCGLIIMPSLILTKYCKFWAVLQWYDMGNTWLMCSFTTSILFTSHWSYNGTLLSNNNDINNLVAWIWMLYINIVYDIGSEMPLDRTDNGMTIFYCVTFYCTVQIIWQRYAYFQFNHAPLWGVYPIILKLLMDSRQMFTRGTQTCYIDWPWGNKDDRPNCVPEIKLSYTILYRHY